MKTFLPTSWLFSLKNNCSMSFLATEKVHAMLWRRKR